MSSTASRRTRRRIERDKKKGIVEELLTIPTEKDVEEYITNKSKELRITDSFDNMDEFFITPQIYGKNK